ncbi:MAG: hypothetical protein GX054_01035 [Clostridiales bacterium]|nr:hypothetical protein [Clostridiales bacterium]
MKKYVLIVIAVVILSISGYAVYNYNQINNPKELFDNGHENKIISDKENENTNMTVSDEIDPFLEDAYEFKDRVNFLFLGIDANKQRYKTMGAFRTDTIMLISIDFDNKKVDIISIPRDSYVKIPGRKNKEKINAAFVRGGGFEGQGFEKTMETVSNFLGGIPIHYYIGIDMNVVKEIVDIMGGVDYEVDVRVKVGNRVIEEGFQRLNGQQVLDYARYRKTAMGDIDRIGRQQKIVLATFNQLKSTDQILKLPRYYTAVMEKVHTNLDIKQIAGLALFATRVDLEDIRFHTIPGGFLDMDRISYWGIDEYKKKELIKEIFGVEIEIDPTNDIKYIRRELEEKEKAFKAAVAKGQEVINDANQLIENYENIIKDQQREKIRSYISQINQAIEDGDIDDINRLSSEARKYIASLQVSLNEHNRVIQQAQATIDDISSKIEEYKSFIKDQEKDQLIKKIDAVKHSIDSKELKSIIQTIEDLESYAKDVFKSCQQRKEAKEKETKEKEDKAIAERNQAIKNANGVISHVNEQMSKYKGIITEDERSTLKKKIDAVNKAINSNDTQAINKAAEDLKNTGTDIFNLCEKRKQEEANKESKQDSAEQNDNTEGNQEDPPEQKESKKASPEQKESKKASDEESNK